MARGRHSLLWADATIFERSHKAYVRPEAATVRYSQSLYHLKSNISDNSRCILTMQQSKSPRM